MAAKRHLLLILLASVLAGYVPAHLRAQDIPLPSDDYKPKVKKRKPKPDILPDAPRLAPMATIPVASLGYGPPSLTYLGRHYALVTLDFLDEDRMLFSFRAPGLLEREATEASSDRQMKAVVLKLPDGSVEAQGLWTVPDRSAYLWMLEDGKFLLRERDGLKVGDPTLKTRLLSELPGQFQSLRMAPTRKIVVTNTLEPPSTEFTIRVISTESGKAIQTSRARVPSASSINSDGYLETTHDKYDQWSLKLNPFAGGSKLLGHVESTCLPGSSFLTDQEILVAGCNLSRIPKLSAVSMTGQVLWESETLLPFLPPLLVPSGNGARFVRESIILKKPVRPGSEVLWVKAVRGQVARVYDSATSKILFEVPINPILDGGGNVAISPSGHRLAVLNKGSIQVYDIPAE
jgi:hypothetical protein